MPIKIYCNPGRSWAACMAQKGNCTPEEIEEAFGVDGSLNGFVRAMRSLEARGYKFVEYCEKCGHEIMAAEMNGKA